MTVRIDTKRYQVPHTAPSLLTHHCPSPSQPSGRCGILFLMNALNSLESIIQTPVSEQDHKQTLDFGRR